MDKFDIIELLARGPLTGAGVWKVQQKQTGSFWSTNSRPKQYAIKQAGIKSPDDPDRNYSPLNEIDIMLQLSNKARIVHLYDNWQHGDYVYMKYELCDFSLAQVLNVKGFELSGRGKVFTRDAHGHVGLVEFVACCYFYREIIKCLAVLHDANPQIIHGNLRLDNFLVKFEGRHRLLVKLADFSKSSRVINSRDTKQINDFYNLGMIMMQLFDIHDGNASIHLNNPDDKIRIAYESIWRIIEDLIDHGNKDDLWTCSTLLTDANTWCIDAQNIIDAGAFHCDQIRDHGHVVDQCLKRIFNYRDWSDVISDIMTDLTNQYGNGTDVIGQTILAELNCAVY